LYPIFNNFNLEIYLDFPYPKGKARIRETNFCDDTGFRFEIQKGEVYTITISHEIYSTEPNCILLDENTIFSSEEGELKFYSDGEGGFLVREKKTNYLKVEAVNSFEGYIGKSIQCGYIEIEKDFEDIIQQINYPDVKYIFSFIENSSEIRNLASKISGSIIPKIETKLAVQDIQDIVEESDEILVARGDLALDITLSDYLDSIKRVVNECKGKKDIIFCTDVLACSGNRLVPYRSEIFDLFLIKSLGCDKIVLPCSKEINLLTKGEKSPNEIMKKIKKELTSKVEVINKIVF
ncbi:pyruvate kinase, partial [Streptococcus salivarius]|uniref:pyruvate kinase n=2 Tax=Streptococcus TaxID=1301 RepID=UPI001C0CB49A